MTQQFKTGDVVRLKSGGPKMTVKGREPAVSHLLEIELDG